MAKVLFISTPYENLGIEYMSAILKSAGHEVSLIIDPCLFFNTYHKNSLLGRMFNYKKYIIEKTAEIKPDLICFSVMTDNYQWALDLSNKIKEKIGTFIVFGGIHPTIAPEIVINEISIDYVCIGEGEDAILELSNRIHNPDDCLRIHNVWTKLDNNVFRNPLRPLFENLDRLPFPDKDIYYKKSGIYSYEYFTMASRGCNYSCAFCCNHILSRIYGNRFLRRRSVWNVIKELSENRKKYNFKFVWFMDDNFASDIDWIREFSREYHRHINLPFFCYIHPNNMVKEVAFALKEANCQEVAIGVESLNENTCKFINRLTNKFTVQKALELLRENRIISVTENILGLPGENEEDILKLINFYNKNRPDLILFSWLKVFPGTEILNLVKTSNLINCQALENLFKGKDKSLAISGNLADKKNFRNTACLLVLVPFLPKAMVSFIIKTKLFKCFCFLNPNLLLRIFRFYRSTMLAMLISGNKTYDVGLKISVRIYRFFLLKKTVQFFRNSV